MNIIAASLPLLLPPPNSSLHPIPHQFTASLVVIIYTHTITFTLTYTGKYRYSLLVI